MKNPRNSAEKKLKFRMRFKVLSRVVSKFKNFIFSIKVKQLLLPTAENNRETQFFFAKM